MTSDEMRIHICSDTLYFHSYYSILILFLFHSSVFLLCTVPYTVRILLCDCLRICFREPEAMDAVTDEHTLLKILAIAETETKLRYLMPSFTNNMAAGTAAEVTETATVTATTATIAADAVAGAGAGSSSTADAVVAVDHSRLGTAGSSSEGSTSYNDILITDESIVSLAIEAKEVALRCLTNGLNENTAATATFLRSGGLRRVMSILTDVCKGGGSGKSCGATSSSDSRENTIVLKSVGENTDASGNRNGSTGGAITNNSGSHVVKSSCSGSSSSNGSSSGISSGSGSGSSSSERTDVNNGTSIDFRDNSIGIEVDENPGAALLTGYYLPSRLVKVAFHATKLVYMLVSQGYVIR
jgi:hypothetical protein